jgi:hypothetical protein
MTCLLRSACPSSSGSVLVNGSVKEAAVSATGTGMEFISGLHDSVTVDLAGVNRLVVDTANGVP